MPLDASIVGMRLGAVEMELTPRLSLAFAAAIDDAASTGTRARVASPFQCVSLEWQCIEDVREALGLSPAEMARAVHAGQRSAFLLPIRAGRRYRVEPVIVNAVDTRAGALVETMSETIDSEDGQVVARTLSSTIYRGIPLSGGEGHASETNVAADAPVHSASLPLPIPRWLPHVYTECANIWNPIHTEPDAARAAGLPGIIVHGTALWALSGNALARKFADGDTGRIASLSGRFVGMAFPGQSLTLRHGRIDARGSLAFDVVDGTSRVILDTGELVFRR